MDAMIDRPIFIFGMPRSGTTIFLQLLANHPDLAWFSNITVRFPSSPWLAVYSRIVDWPIVGQRIPYGWRLRPKPTEAYGILNYITDQTFTQPRLLTPEDCTERAKRRFRQSVSAHLRWQRKTRFLHKHTGFPRIEYLSQVFPDALFLHIVRDGRAVAHSMKRMKKWKWWDGTMKSWCWGSLDPEDRRYYEDTGQETIILAALMWKTLMQRANEAKRNVPGDRFLEIHYENLVSDPSVVLGDVLRFCGLRKSDEFFRRVDRVPIWNSDSKWRSSLSAKEQALLEDYFSRHVDASMLGKSGLPTPDELPAPALKS